jgi:aryl-alcohol dehydrogenase-like predicted oxidoreductase
VVAIPGASSLRQLESNAAAADLELSDEENERLTKSAESFQPIRGPGMVTGLVSSWLRR